jgi:hypothetical protein
MNTLQKCIDELKKEQPDIRYILGMLETYLELSGGNIKPPVSLGYFDSTKMETKPIIPADEEVTDIQRAYDTGRVGKVT